MTSEVVDGKYVVEHNGLVTFRFTRVDGLVLNDFRFQNVLQQLYIRDISDDQLEDLKFEVGFEGIIGVDAHFRCNSVRVLSVVPFDKGQLAL